MAFDILRATRTDYRRVRTDYRHILIIALEKLWQEITGRLDTNLRIQVPSQSGSA